MSGGAGITRAVLADDEPLARRSARRLLEEQAVVVVAECADGAAVVAAVREHRPDLLVLDIARPECNGFEALRRLGDAAPPTIMLTAFPAYAVAAIDAGVVGFVPKPPDRALLARSIARARARGAGQLHGRGNVPFAVRTRDGLILVPPSDVEAIDAADNYVELNVGRRRHMLACSMAHLEASLPGDFVRVHRGCIVNVAHVRGLRRKLTGDYELTLRSGRLVAVGRSYRSRVASLGRMLRTAL